jgi:hypothetical protein
MKTIGIIGSSESMLSLYCSMRVLRRGRNPGLSARNIQGVRSSISPSSIHAIAISKA